MRKGLVGFPRGEDQTVATSRRWLVLALPAPPLFLLMMGVSLDIAQPERAGQGHADKTQHKQTAGTPLVGWIRRSRDLFEVHVRNPARSDS
jgi:hypothetical protein